MLSVDNLRFAWPDGPEFSFSLNSKFRVIYADPPWSYGNTQPDYQSEQRDHYPVMALQDICDLDIKSIAADTVPGRVGMGASDSPKRTPTRTPIETSRVAPVPRRQPQSASGTRNERQRATA